MRLSAGVAEHRRVGRGGENKPASEGCAPSRRRPKSSLTRDEQETHIQRTAAENSWSFFSCDPVSIRQMEKLAAAHPDDVKLVQRTKHSAEWEIPRKWVRVRPPRRMSEKQLEHSRRLGRQYGKLRKQASVASTSHPPAPGGAVGLSVTQGAESKPASMGAPS